MAEDELLEIRRIRHEISERYGHDPDRYVDHLQELQRRLLESGRYDLTDTPLAEARCRPARNTDAAA